MQQAPNIDATTSRVNRPRLLEATLLVVGASTGFLLASDAGVAWQVSVTLMGWPPQGCSSSRRVAPVRGGSDGF